MVKANFNLFSFKLFFDFFRKLKIKKLYIFFFAFLFLRIILCFCYGTQDMEWWKAWTVDIVKNGITNVYGASDNEIIKEYKDGNTKSDILLKTQKIIHYNPKNYTRLEYKVTQPPIYVYTLYIAGNLYKSISHTLINSRLFNFFINLIPILFSILTVYIIYMFIKSTFNHDTAILTASIYWLSPLVLLNSPIQGYFDPLITFFVSASVVLLYKKQLTWSYIFLVLGILSKPTAIIVFPVFLGIGLKEHSIKKNIIAWLISVVTVLIVIFPFIFNGRVLSMFQGVWSINESSQDLSRQSMNLWWVIQYGYHAIHNLTSIGSKASAIMGGPGSNWESDIPCILLNNLLGFNVQIIGLILLGLFTILNLWYISVNLYTKRNVIFIASGLQIYAYFILRVGVQANHYFVLIPLFAIVSLFSIKEFKYYILISFIFFIQDLIFYGLGRDFNHGKQLLTLFYSGWFSNILALANVVLFIWICFKEFSPCFQIKTKNNRHIKRLMTNSKVSNEK